MSPTNADLIERAVAIPPAIAAGATIFGYPVADLTAWLMFLYALSLVLWHFKTKWLSRWFE